MSSSQVAVTAFGRQCTDGTYARTDGARRRLLRIGAIAVNCDARAVTCITRSSRSLDLSSTSSRLLAHEPNTVMTRERIARTVWNTELSPGGRSMHTLLACVQSSGQQLHSFRRFGVSVTDLVGDATSLQQVGDDFAWIGPDRAEEAARWLLCPIFNASSPWRARRRRDLRQAIIPTRSPGRPTCSTFRRSASTHS